MGELRMSGKERIVLDAMGRLNRKELTVVAARKEAEDRWPLGYISETRLFDVPVDYVRDSPHLLCESYVIYPYMVKPRIEMSA